MALITINGMTIPITATEQISDGKEIVGAGKTRAQTGALRTNFNATKWHPKLKTSRIGFYDYAFLVALLMGLGDRWTFDSDFYSDKCAEPSSSSGASIVTASPTPKYGAGCLELTSGTGSIAWTVDAPDAAASKGWTVAFWCSPGNSSWAHYILTVDYSGVQTVYVNGSPGALPSNLSVTLTNNGATLTISNTNAGVYTIDDMLYVPAYLGNTQGWPAQLYSFANSQAWAYPYPALQVGGDGLPASLVMMGEVGDSVIKLGRLNGAAFADNLQEMPFELIQV